MQQSGKDDANDKDADGQVFFVLIVQYCCQARVNAVARINLEPKEEIIRLLVGPDDFNDDAGEGNLTDDHAVPYAVEEVEASPLMNIPSILPFIEIHLEEFEDVDLADDEGEVTTLSDNSGDQCIKVKSIENVFCVQLFFVYILQCLL